LSALIVDSRVDGWIPSLAGGPRPAWADTDRVWIETDCSKINKDRGAGGARNKGRQGAQSLEH
jgi:hypothetical protein